MSKFENSVPHALSEAVVWICDAGCRGPVQVVSPHRCEGAPDLRPGGEIHRLGLPDTLHVQSWPQLPLLVEEDFKSLLITLVHASCNSNERYRYITLKV